MKLSTDEIHLMRAIIAWRKANGVEFSTMHGCWREATVYDRVMPRRVGRAITFDPDDGALGISAGGTWSHEYRWHKVDSLTQAVDVLVAFGYLPPRFSSAYAAGWEARHDAITRACVNGMGDPGWNAVEVQELVPAATR